MARKLINWSAGVFITLVTLGALLVTLGALGWGVYGLSRVFGFMGGNFLLVDWLVRYSWLANTLYILVGVAGILLIPSVIAMIWNGRR